MMNLSGFSIFQKQTTFDCLCEISFTAWPGNQVEQPTHSRSVSCDSQAGTLPCVNFGTLRSLSARISKPTRHKGLIAAGLFYSALLVVAPRSSQGNEL